MKLVRRVFGTPGSGKTTLAELLMYNQSSNNNDSKWLYITKSAKLASYVEKEYRKFKTENQEDQKQLTQIEFKTYQALCDNLIFKKLFLEDNFAKYREYIQDKLKNSKQTINIDNPEKHEVLSILSRVNDVEKHHNNHPYLLEYLKSKLHNIEQFIEWIENIESFKDYLKKIKIKKQDSQTIQTIAREIYEDIHKLNDKIFGSSESQDVTLGKKDSYEHDISKEILELYKNHLAYIKALDLSLLDSKDIESNKENFSQYDYIVVDETQDFGKTELSLITSFLNDSGSGYFFLDSNQSLFNDFNLTSKYIDEIAEDLHKDIKEYKLTSTYRTPQNITKVLGEILQVKGKIMGEY
ncbi:MAG: AAA family ATPase [Candidatus Rickettsia vulgarisii]